MLMPITKLILFIPPPAEGEGIVYTTAGAVTCEEITPRLSLSFAVWLVVAVSVKLPALAAWVSDTVFEAVAPPVKFVTVAVMSAPGEGIYSGVKPTAMLDEGLPDVPESEVGDTVIGELPASMRIT